MSDFVLMIFQMAKVVVLPALFITFIGGVRFSLFVYLVFCAFVVVVFLFTGGSEGASSFFVLLFLLTTGVVSGICVLLLLAWRQFAHRNSPD